jgi:plasmid stability protein
MATIQLRNLPEDLHRGLLARAHARNQSMTQYLTDLLRQDLALPSVEEWIEENRRPLASRPPIDVSPEQMLADTRPVDSEPWQPS